jgi:hypothetical protein
MNDEGGRVRARLTCRRAFPSRFRWAGQKQCGVAAVVFSLLALLAQTAVAATFGPAAINAGYEFGLSTARAIQGASEFHWQPVRAPRHRCYGCAHRSGPAKRQFKRRQPCPSTGRSTGRCPGYVIDHIKPLNRGGADTPDNMQWQTKEAAKAKDRWE